MLALLAATAAVSALLLVGMALAVVDTLHADRPDSRRTAGGSGIPTAPTGDGSAATVASPASTGSVIDPVTEQAARDALANCADAAGGRLRCAAGPGVDPRSGPGAATARGRSASARLMWPPGFPRDPVGGDWRNWRRSTRPRCSPGRWPTRER